MTTHASYKTCPKCQTPAPPDAQTCNRCGRAFRTTDPQPDFSRPDKYGASGYKPFYILAAALVAASVLLFIGLGIAWVRLPKVPILTVKQLMTDQALYNGKTVTIHARYYDSGGTSPTLADTPEGIQLSISPRPADINVTSLVEATGVYNVHRQLLITTNCHVIGPADSRY